MTMRWLLRLAAALLVMAAPGMAQLSDAGISGVVADQQGAVVAGAEIAALNVETGVKTSTATNQTGFYSLRPLPIGRYTVSARSPGFRHHVREGIVLNTGLALELNISLAVGSVDESVTISATASPLETRAAGADQLIESKTIEDVPPGDRRAMNLIELTGAAVFVDYSNSIAKPQFVLAGGRAQSQGFFIDGGGQPAHRRSPQPRLAGRRTDAPALVRCGRVPAAGALHFRQPGHRSGAGGRDSEHQLVDHPGVPVDRAEAVAVPGGDVQHRPNFRLPGHVFGSSGFGVVAAARRARQVQLGLQLAF